MTSNNLEAAEEIVRQLRLRDIGGIIVIDFIDMVLPSNRELLLRRLVECLGRDRTRHQVAEITSLGLVQMTRKKIGTGLLEAFTTECPHCHGRGVRDARHAGRVAEAARRGPRTRPRQRVRDGSASATGREPAAPTGSGRGRRPAAARRDEPQGADRRAEARAQAEPQTAAAEPRRLSRSGQAEPVDGPERRLR